MRKKVKIERKSKKKILEKSWAIKTTPLAFTTHLTTGLTPAPSKTR